MDTAAEELLDFLIDSARYGDTEDVDVAIKQGVAVDGQDESGRTALHMACANGHGEIAKLLLEANASPDIKNAEGNTPMHWACLNGHTEVVQALLDKGATAAVLNNAGRTPVDEALARGHQAVIDVINSCNTGAGIEVEVEEVDGDETCEKCEAAPCNTAQAERSSTAAQQQQHEQQPEEGFSSNANGHVEGSSSTSPAQGQQDGAAAIPAAADGQLLQAVSYQLHLT
eukprot:GHRR01005340.1.p1 GENE.GHRR01005340.1~~GHRR01005340.1.p1  ORF type:complete len:228 (+),score=102.66 GHRR01005340.1:210-893(+)